MFRPSLNRRSCGALVMAWWLSCAFSVSANENEGRQVGDRNGERPSGHERRGETDYRNARDRRQGGWRAMWPPRDDRYRERRAGPRRHVRRTQITGQIEEMQTVYVGKQPFVMCHLVTPDGYTVEVRLGPEEPVRELDVQEGDRAKVEGVRARLGGRRTVMARRVTTNGRTMRVELLCRAERQVRRHVMNLRIRRHDDRDGHYALARVRTEEGQRRTVYLGRPDKVERLDLRKGDRISVLGRPGRVDGRAAFVADQVSVAGETVDVREGHRVYDATYSAEDRRR